MRPSLTQSVVSMGNINGSDVACDVYSVCISLFNRVRSLKGSRIFIDRTQQLSYLNTLLSN